MAFHLIIISILLTLILGLSLISTACAILPVFLIVSMFILLGTTIGYFSQSQETASVISLIVITGAIFFSNTILPIESLPARIKDIILYNPFVVSEALIKKILIFSFTLDKVLPHLIVIIGYNALFLILSYLGLKYSKYIFRR